MESIPFRVPKEIFPNGLILRVVFDPDAGDIESRIEETIRASISEWMPYVTVKQVKTEADERNPNQLNVRIDFTIDVDQRVEQLDLNLRLADQGTIGQEMVSLCMLILLMTLLVTVNLIH